MITSTRQGKQNPGKHVNQPGCIPPQPPRHCVNTTSDTVRSRPLPNINRIRLPWVIDYSNCCTTITHLLHPEDAPRRTTAAVAVPDDTLTVATYPLSPKGQAHYKTLYKQSWDS